jgi:hypothetical protein
MVQVGSEEDARELAARLLMPGRRWPVAVVTVAAGETEPYVDVWELSDCLRGFAEIVVMPTSDISWAFSAAMPDGTHVYGGASRVYPVAHEWVSMPRRAPLRFAYSVRDRERVTTQVIADAMSAAVAAGLYPPAGAPASRPVRGIVATVLGTRALIRLDDGQVVTLWEELSGYPVPLERLLALGQPLEGTVDPEARRLDLLPIPKEDATRPDQLPETYVEGAVVLAQVDSVGARALTVLLTPNTQVEVGRDDVTGNELDGLQSLFAKGDVVVARVQSLTPLQLSLLDVDDDEVPVEAPAILPGGPPWLLLPPEPTSDAAPDTAPSAVSDDAVVRTQPVEPEQRSIHPVNNALPARTIHPKPSDMAARRFPAPTSAAPLAPAGSSGPAVRDLSLALAAERARSAGLESQLAETSGAVKELTRMRQLAQSLEQRLQRAEQAKTAYRKKYVYADRRRQAMERTQKADRAEDDPRAWFTDPEDALRYAVQAAWTRRIPAGEKERWPLRKWHVGPEFIDSLADLGQVSWHKLTEVIADIVVGDPHRLAALDQHELRTSQSGAAPARVRADGATAYRVALQQHAPSARRLHYWRRRDCIELSRVVQHDDMAA